MFPDADFLSVFIPITTSCIVGLVGMKIFLNYRRDVLVDRNRGEEDKNLVEDVKMLREEMLYLREGFEDISERLEFHERLLTKTADIPADTPV